MWELNQNKCLKCGGCVSVCPFGALELSEQGVLRNESKCTLCGLCKKACPVGAIKVSK